MNRVLLRNMGSQIYHRPAKLFSGTLTQSSLPIVSLCLVFGACKHDTQLFELLSPDQTGITFANNLVPAETLNTYVFRNFYNGGGVAIGNIKRSKNLHVMSCIKRYVTTQTEWHHEQRERPGA